ncbi:MAG TPA: OmpA family protein, partial [Bdellovibrionales bacterium]|nr:OmpA family protein [Bdellovibrionales bacterium]
KFQKAEGKVTKFVYLLPEGRSILEIARNYKQALAKAKIPIIAEYSGRKLGSPYRINKALGAPTNGKGICHVQSVPPEEQIYIAAQKPGQVTVALYFLVCKSGRTPMGRLVVTIVDAAKMEGGLVQADAAALAAELEASGHASVYGIEFDFDSAVIKPESKPVLDEVAKLLGMKPQLRLFVVGHTDGQGKVDYNMKLSQERARSVVKALAADYKVSPARLVGYGVGPLAPKASNKSEDGKAQNRRVELVEM